MHLAPGDQPLSQMRSSTSECPLLGAHSPTTPRSPCCLLHKGVSLLFNHTQSLYFFFSFYIFILHLTVWGVGPVVTIHLYSLDLISVHLHLTSMHLDSVSVHLDLVSKHLKSVSLRLDSVSAHPDSISAHLDSVSVPPTTLTHCPTRLRPVPACDVSC